MHVRLRVRQRCHFKRLQRAIPIRKIHIGRPHLDAMLLRIAYDLSRRVKTHWLAVEQRGREHVRIAAFNPSGRVDKIGETRGMAFGKTVTAESLDLFSTSHGEFRVITAAVHSADKLLFPLPDSSDVLE